MEKPAIRVRAARPEDASMLAQLGAATFSETYFADNTQANMRQHLQANFHPDVQARELADPSTWVLVAEAGDEAAGYAKLQLGEPPACVHGPSPIEVARIYVTVGYHGRGIGAALMNACIERGRALGARTIWLGVWENNHRAQAFYRRFGFVECGDHEFTLGSDRQRDIVMVRQLHE
jgi:ribosomal protein S18 acetylase RimI-like enzyme